MIVPYRYAPRHDPIHARGTPVPVATVGAGTDEAAAAFDRAAAGAAAGLLLWPLDYGGEARAAAGGAAGLALRASNDHIASSGRLDQHDAMKCCRAAAERSGGAVQQAIIRLRNALSFIGWL